MNKIFDEIKEELTFAQKNFKPFNSFHEGYAVIKEEVDELWEEVRKWKGDGKEDKERLRKEAKQVATMALRFMLDLCEKEK